MTSLIFVHIFYQINRIGDNSEMSHRSHQSSSEDARSRNKRSEVLRKYKAMDGATRRQAMEVLGRHSSSTSRAELWNKKDLTCRIFLVSSIGYRRSVMLFAEPADNVLDFN